MSYIPPGVTVTEVQQTLSPVLNPPDLVPVVIAPAYIVNQIQNSYGTIYPLYTNSPVVITISGLTGYALDNSSVYVDLVVTPGLNSQAPLGRYIVSGISSIGNTVTIPGNQLPVTASGFAQIQIGFRALRYDVSQLYEYQSVSDVIELLDDTSSFNPLGLAVSTAMANSNSPVFGYGVMADEFAYSNPTPSGNVLANHQTALQYLAMQEIYAIAPATVQSDVISAYDSAVDSLSQPVEKKERIVFVAPTIPWSDPVNPQNNTSTTAATISANAGAYADFRVFYVHPDTAFTYESRHVTTLSPTYVLKMYENGFSTTPYAYLAQSVTFSSSNAVTQYQGVTLTPIPGKGIKITQQLWLALLSQAQLTGNAWYYAYIPVPSCVLLTPAIVGQVAGQTPEQGLTNLPIASVDHIKYSSDWFTESQLNTIASGGVFIMKQATETAPIVCRHQLSTDRSSIQKQELSITKVVDYTAKYVRNTATPYIGKYNITPAVLSFLSTVIKGVGADEVKKGILNSFTLSSLTQDTIQLDTVNAYINIGPPYPVNHISIYLIF